MTIIHNYSLIINRPHREFFKWLFIYKGAEATSIKIIERIKKCFRMKDVLDLSVSWNFQIRWTCISSIIYKTKKLFSSPVFSNKKSKLLYFQVFKVNGSVYISSRIYQFCWQYAIILVWKTWSSALNQLYIRGYLCSLTIDPRPLS